MNPAFPLCKKRISGGIMSCAIGLLYQLPVKIASDTLAYLSPNQLEALRKISEKTHRLVLHHLIYTNQGQKVICPQIFDEISFAKLVGRSLCIKSENSRCLKAWDISSNRPHTLAKLPDDETLFELVDNRLYLVSASSGLQVLDPNSGDIIRQCSLENFAAQGTPSYFKFCQNHLYCCFENSRLLCWNIDNGQIDASFYGLSSKVTHLIAQGNLVAVSSEDNSLTIWFRHGQNPLSICKGHQHAVRQIALCNSLLISASIGGSIRFWDLATSQCIKTYVTHMPYFTLHDTLLYTPSVTDPCRIDVIDLTSLSITACTSRHEKPIVCCFKDGDIVYTGAVNGSIVRTMNSTEYIVFQQRHKGAVTKIMPLDDGLVVSYGQDQTAKVWKAETGELLQSFVLEHFNLNTFMYSQGRIIFVSEMNIFGAYDYSKPIPTSTSPRIAALIPTGTSLQNIGL